MSEENSYRQILRSSSIIGCASVVNIALSLLRTKVAAVLLGPTGVGLIGLLTNIVATASTVAGLGFGNVGTRQIAKAVAANESMAIATARRALFWGTFGLALLGSAVFWASRGLLAVEVVGDRSLADGVGWLSLAVALTVASASQTALLNGMRRIGDLARVAVWSGVFSTAIGLIALLMWGSSGITAYVVAAPLSAFVIGHWYVARLPKLQSVRMSFSALLSEWSQLATLGFAFMVAGLAGTVGQLAVRTEVQRQIGSEALGHFQASWAISMTYIGFVLGAMGKDYYPRLTAVVHDPGAVSRLVNEQTEVALLLATPVLLAMMGLAPWVIELLYSDAFRESVTILRWQVFGDVLKIASWPLGYVLLASGAGRTFMIMEWAAVGCFVGLAVLLLPVVGINATGIAFFGMYVAYLFMVFESARRKFGFIWSRLVTGLVFSAAAAATLILFIAQKTPIGGAIAAVVFSAGFGTYSLFRLAHAGTLGGRAIAIAAFILIKFRNVKFWHS